ncbi:MAG: hypothetical protein CBB97_22575 [Candidatus Endolissoclinum sp. TMED37]|nr:MAG: hypothetical protein CBB97_22575 [Candidatus Endolissoclinum sp. TMED37]|tara:strand:+ start:112 stop:1446 length:1335 start_codon:yes stop_codon:yes gene_type:complete
MQLSHQQENAFKHFKNNTNLFLTGPGGSGKTRLIHEFVSYAINSNKRVQVCALTGCATVLLQCPGSKTLHSWAGIGLGTGPSNDIVARVIKNPKKIQKWKHIDILIVDEVSMMSKKIFEILNRIGCIIHNNNKPFGGIQLVFSGDFYQLPPVGSYSDADSSLFCFESTQWFNTFPISVELNKIYRQNDKVYLDILNELRIGNLSKNSCDILNTRVGKPIDKKNIIEPTILLPRRKDADIINSKMLNALNGDKKTYKLVGVCTKKNTHNNTIRECELELENMQKNILADQELILKIGAQVMCIANIDINDSFPIFNGSQGIVTAFDNDFPVVKFNNGHERTIVPHIWTSESVPSVEIKQIPLIHAWALTIHKAQGATLELAQIDAGSNMFECGQMYVALSRVKSLDALYLTAFNALKIKINQKVQEFYSQLFEQNLDCTLNAIVS